MLAMRTINHEADVDRFGCEELEKNRYQADVNYRVKYKSYEILHVSGDF